MDAVMKELLTDILFNVQSINTLLEELLVHERRRAATDHHLTQLADALFEDHAGTLPTPDPLEGWWRDTRGNYLIRDADGNERMLTSQEIEQVTMTPRRAAALRAKRG